MKNLIFALTLLGLINCPIKTEASQNNEKKAPPSIITCVAGQGYATSAASYNYQAPYGVLTITGTATNQSCTPPQPPPSGGSQTNAILCLNGIAYIMSDGLIYYPDFFEVPTAKLTNDTCKHYLDEIFANGFDNNSNGH